MSKPIIREIKEQIALNSQAFSSAGVVNGEVIDLAGYAAENADIGVVLSSGALATGSIEVKDFQFSSVADFTSDVSTVDLSNSEVHFIKGDSSSDVDALTQTLITLANVSKKIGLHNPTIKRYARARFETKGTVDLTAFAIYIVRMLNTPVNQ